MDTVFFVAFLLGAVAVAIFAVFNSGGRKFISSPVTRHDFKIVSGHDPDTVYYVGIADLTCTCPDWLGRRRQYGRDDPRRLCKHLVRCLVDEEFGQALPAQLADHRVELEQARLEDRGYPV